MKRTLLAAGLLFLVSATCPASEPELQAVPVEAPKELPATAASPAAMPTAIVTPAIMTIHAPQGGGCCRQKPCRVGCLRKLWCYLTYYPHHRGRYLCCCCKRVSPCYIPPLYVYFLDTGCGAIGGTSGCCRRPPPDCCARPACAAGPVTGPIVTNIQAAPATEEIMGPHPQWAAK